MLITYSNNQTEIVTDVRVYTGDLYGDSVFLCTEKSLYLDLKDIWHGDEAVTKDNLDFDGQTTEIDEYIDPDNWTSYNAYNEAMENLLDVRMTGTSNLWQIARKYIRAHRVKEKEFYQ